MHLLILTLCLMAASFGEALKLPSYITPCSRSDPKFIECATKSANAATPIIIKGDRKYRFPVLDPLEITQFIVDDTGGAVGLKMAFENIRLLGLSQSKIEDFFIDFEKKKLKYLLVVPRMEMLSNYEVSGKILILPITGKGPANITLHDFRNTFTQSFELYTKPNGKVHFKFLPDAAQNFTAGHVSLKLENLFGGNKLLGDQMNDFINDNVDVMVKEVGPSIADAIMFSIQNGFNYLVDKVSYEDIFLP